MDIIQLIPNPETDLAMSSGDPFWTPVISLVGVVIIAIIFVWIRNKKSSGLEEGK